LSGTPTRGDAVPRPLSPIPSSSIPHPLSPLVSSCKKHQRAVPRWNRALATRNAHALHAAGSSMAEASWFLTHDGALPRPFLIIWERRANCTRGSFGKFSRSRSSGSSLTPGPRRDPAIYPLTSARPAVQMFAAPRRMVGMPRTRAPFAKPGLPAIPKTRSVARAHKQPPAHRQTVLQRCSAGNAGGCHQRKPEIGSPGFGEPRRCRRSLTLRPYTPTSFAKYLARRGEFQCGKLGHFF
jgi:hypothetical protein